jgi:hypothetical protein
MDENSFGFRAYRFYLSLKRPSVPRGVGVMNPYANPATRRYVRAFLGSFFADNTKRVLVFGINPGRFGAGITGVTFTDPVALSAFCGIPNALGRTRELSSVFIYDFINAFGGPAEVYSRFFLTAVSPLGFTREGINLNYYDNPELKRRVTPFVVSTIERQIAMGGRTDHAIVLGRGQNAKYLMELNAAHGWFGAIHPLEHPRWILQYRRKTAAKFVADYVRTFERVLVPRD